MSTEHSDTVIIGGGLMGLSAALALALRGQKVRLIEAQSIARHASSASAGGVRSLNRHPEEIALVRAALPLWRTLSRQLGHPCGFLASGQIRVATDDSALEALRARRQQCCASGYDHEQLIDPPAVYRHLPMLAPGCRGALFVDDDGHADPLATAHAYRLAATRAGVSLLEGWRVTALVHDGSRWQLEGSRTGQPSHTCEWSATTVVNAAGAWGHTLSASVGEPVPATPTALQMTVTAPVPPFVSTVVGCQGRRLSLKQTRAGAVVIGGGFSGEVIGAYPEQARGRIDQAGAIANLANAVALFPHLADARVVRQWAGIEGIVADALPVLCASRRAPGLIHAFGFSAHGFALVPLVGPLVADLAEGRNINLPLEAFRIDRFTLSSDSEAA